MDHSYEEIRRAAVDLLSGRENNSPYSIDQFASLRTAVGVVLQKRDGATDVDQRYPPFSNDEHELFQEVFWDLFRQGIITFSDNYPSFRVSSFGKKILENESVYFFHDLSSYESIIRENIPNIDELTVFYLKEAMQDFLVDCRLSSSVILGVAIEHSLDKLYEIVGQNDTYRDHFSSVFEETLLLRKFNKFKNKLKEKHKDLSSRVKEDLDTNMDMIVSVIRNFRNESGHPSGKVLSREQCYVNLHLFIPCCKKIYDLMEFFKV